MSDNRPLAFCIPEYQYLFPTFCELGEFETGALEIRPFPDGERYMRVLTDVKGRDVILLGGTVSDAATLTLYDLACAMVKHGARRLRMVLPFFGYSTMERAVRPGEVVVAKTRARLLSAVPPASEGNTAVLLDLHSEGIPHYFEGSITTRHVYAKSVILEAVRAMGGAGSVLGSTDAGRAKWVESLANDLAMDAAFVFKRRVSGNETEISAMMASVSGQHVIIYDDMIRTGGSLVGAAKAYLDAGATRISAIATHGIFVDDSLERLRDSGLFEHLVATDSHPRAHALADEGLQVLPLAPVLVAPLRGEPTSNRDL